MNEYEAIKKAVGNTSYGKFLLDKLDITKYYKEENVLHVEINIKDSLEELIGVLKVYNKYFDNLDEDLKKVSNEEKLRILKLALKAVEKL